MKSRRPDFPLRAEARASHQHHDTVEEDITMAWFVLMVSGALEAVWAVALSQSEGFTKLQPSLLFIVGLVLSMAGLGYALRTLPVGTGYAVWVGIGAVTTAAWSLSRGYEAVTGLKVFFLLGIVVCVIGLQLVSTEKLN